MDSIRNQIKSISKTQSIEFIFYKQSNLSKMIENEGYKKFKSLDIKDITANEFKKKPESF